MAAEDSIRPDASTVHRAGGSRADVLPTLPPGDDPVASDADREIAEAQTVIRGSSRSLPPAHVANPVDRTPASVAKVLLGQRLNHFRLDEMIGGGGMGAVFRAHDEQLDRTVAIKVIPFVGEDPDLQRRFRNEAQSAAKLDHPRIAKVFDAGNHGPWHYIVFEYVEGTNIRDWVTQHGVLSIDEAVLYTAQLADSLQHAAERGIVHRDIKPSNVLIASDGKIKLVDMGLARSEGLDLSEDMTASGVTLGTFDYISPEQAHDPRDADLRSDIYSLGCTLHFMLTASPPYPGGTMLQKLLSHGNAPPPDPRDLRPEVSDNLVSVLQKMLAKKPADRYQNANDLMADLHVVAARDGLARAMSLSAPVVTPPSVLLSWLEKNLPWMVATALLVAVAGWLQLESAASREDLVIPDSASRPIMINSGPSPRRPTAVDPGDRTNGEGGQGDGGLGDGGPGDGGRADGGRGDGGVAGERLPVRPGSQNGIAGDAAAQRETPRFEPAETPPRLTDFPVPPELMGSDWISGDPANQSLLPQGFGMQPDSLGPDSLGNDSLGPDSLRAVRPDGAGGSADNKMGQATGARESSAMTGNSTGNSIDMIDAASTAEMRLGSGRQVGQQTDGGGRSGERLDTPAFLDQPRLVRVLGPQLSPDARRDRNGAALAPTLAGALELARRYDLTRIEIAVPVLYSGPVKIDVDHLLITSSVGGGSMIIFQSGDMVKMERSKMVSIGSHPIEFNDIHFVWNVPRDEIDGGALFYLNDNQSVEMTDCSVTINNPALREEVYAIDIVTDPDKLPRDRRDAVRAEAFPLVDVKLYNVILRGQMTMLHMDYAAKLWLDWDNGMLAITERMIDMAGARVAPPAGSGSIKLSMTRVTAQVPQGVMRTRLGVSGAHPVPISRLARKCTFVVDPSASHFEVTGLPSLPPDSNGLRLEGASNAYAVQPTRVDAMLRLLTIDGQSRTTRMSDLSTSPPDWADENRPQWSVDWVAENLTQEPTNLRRPADYRQMESTSPTGFDENLLPTLPAGDGLSTSTTSANSRVATGEYSAER